MKTIAATFGVLLLVACATERETATPPAVAGVEPAAAETWPGPADASLAQHRGRVFVAQFSVDEADVGLAQMAESAVTGALVGHFPAGVTGYQELANIAQHAALSDALGVEESTELRDLAGQVEADYVALGSLSRAGDLLSLNIAIFDAKQKRVVNRISERHTDPDALVAAIEPAIRSMYDLPVRIASAQIKALIQSKIGLVKHCYNRQLELDPNLAGKAVVEFVIMPDGTVTKVGLDPERSTLTDLAFATCIEVAIMSLNLGFQIQKEISVAYPFTFEPR